MSTLNLITNARIECSVKTLKELGLHKDPVGYGRIEVDPFFCWYAHLLYLNRKKCLLFVNVLTRYPVLAVNLSREDIQDFNAVLGESLKPQLRDEGVSEGAINRFLEHLFRPEISKSSNRSIIGTAVEYERMIRDYTVYSDAHHFPITEAQISMRLARIPILSMKPEPFSYKVFSSELKRRYGDSGRFDFDPFSKKTNQ
jgi:hypothetical protein